MTTTDMQGNMTTLDKLREVLQDVSLLWSATTLLEHSINEELIDALPRHLGDVMMKLRAAVAEIEAQEAA